MATNVMFGFAHNYHDFFRKNFLPKSAGYAIKRVTERTAVPVLGNVQRLIPMTVEVLERQADYRESVGRADDPEVSVCRMVRHTLIDKEWHSLRDVYNHVASMIPPKRAVAVYHRQNQYPERETMTQNDVEHHVMVGRKRAVYRAMLQLYGVGYLQFGRGCDWHRQVRLTRAGLILTRAELAGSRRRRIGRVFRVAAE